MSTSYVSKKLKVETAKAFRDSFRESSPRKIGYVFISKTSEFENEPTPDNIIDTVKQEKQSWDDMVGAKRIESKDVEFVIPKYEWKANTRYKQYDDQAELDDLLTVSEENGEQILPMYVINSEGNVYKCLCNNESQRSQVEPTGTYTENDGFIQTEFGNNSCYLWKYMYNVRVSNKFLEDEWIPVPYINTFESFPEYDYNTNNLVEGSLNKIELINRGQGYFHSEINVSPFVVGSNTLTILDDIDLTSSNTIKPGMLVTGNGLFSDQTYITQVNPALPKTLYLSEPTISSGGGTSPVNRISVTTRVVIIGDGTETTTSVRLSANNQVEKIDILSAGINYTQANVQIFGSQTTEGLKATARAILPPKFGHGYNPAVELGATNVMLLSRIGEVDATENDIIPVDIFFRQYGLLVSPYKYNGELITENNVPNVVSMTTDLSLLSFSNFAIGEMVYQGSLDNPDFYGYVVYQSSNVVKLNSIYKNPVVGRIISGTTSGTQNVVIGVKNADLLKYAGNILYCRNVLKVQRSLAQAEQVKLIFQF
jgi:hypothetical protein